MSDLISRDKAVATVLGASIEYQLIYGKKEPKEGFVRSLIKSLANIPQEEPEWIPFKTRPLTDEEKEDHPEWDIIVDCQLPENGQQILVSCDIAGHERVQFDEFYDDAGVYLDSGYEIGREAVAWMPLPKPYHEAER